MKRPPLWFWLAAALALLPLMISGESLWIDEAQTAKYAREPDFASFVDRLIHDSYSEAMMPLPMALAWGWVRLLGDGEIALRLPNLLYLAAAFWAVWRLGVRAAFAPLVLMLACHPFVWFYANEARPYALQIALASLLLLCADGIHQAGPSPRRTAVFLLLAWLLSATSMLAVFPVAILSLVLISGAWRRRVTLEKRTLWILLAGVLVFLPLGLFYLSAVLRGSSSARLWSVGAQNLVFTIYEMVGAQGLGPGRTEMREAASSMGSLVRCFAPHLPLLSAHGLCLLLWVRYANVPRGDVAGARLARLCTVWFAFSLLLVFTLAVSAHFPFWGRHFAPVFPAFLVAALLWRPAPGRFRFAGWMPLLLGLLWLASSLGVRFSPRFAKDDYREAARVAKEALARGETVWWAANTEAGVFYGLPAGSTDRFRIFMSPGEKDLDGVATARLIILSKPDIYDASAHLRDYVAQHRYERMARLPAFDIWRRRVTE